MGQVFARESHAEVLVVGLDNAGKTSLIRHFRANKHRRTEDVAPTVGVSRDLLRLPEHNLLITAFDMSGQSRYRNLWDHQLNSQVSGVIFVIDAADTMRFIVARDELDVLLKHRAMTRPPPVPILFLANKSDLPNAAGPTAVAQKMKLDTLPSNIGPWHICATNGLTGVGLEPAFDWIAKEMKSRAIAKKKRNQ